MAWKKIYTKGRGNNGISAPIDKDVLVARITKKGRITFCCVASYLVEKWDHGSTRVTRGWYDDNACRVDKVTHWAPANLQY